MHATHTLRVAVTETSRFGPGKARLLALVGKHGSISAAAREMGMSYRRAWLLVEEMNAVSAEKLVAARAGGKSGGGADLTPHGERVLRAYERLTKEVAASPAMDIFLATLSGGTVYGA